MQNRICKCKYVSMCLLLLAHVTPFLCLCRHVSQQMLPAASAVSAVMFCSLTFGCSWRCEGGLLKDGTLSWLCLSLICVTSRSSLWHLHWINIRAAVWCCRLRSLWEWHLLEWEADATLAQSDPWVHLVSTCGFSDLVLPPQSENIAELSWKTYQNIQLQNIIKSHFTLHKTPQNVHEFSGWAACVNANSPHLDFLPSFPPQNVLVKFQLNWTKSRMTVITKGGK